MLLLPLEIYSLDLENAENKQLFLRSVLESSKVLNGVNQPLSRGHDLISQESPSYVLALLERCLETHHYPAAVGAPKCWETSEMKAFFTQQPAVTRLIQALNNPSRRVRFAVTNAIFKLNPTRLSLVAAMSPGQQPISFKQRTRKAIAADVNPDRSLKWAGLLSQAGFEGERVLTGKD